MKNMSLQTDVDLLFGVYDALQDMMKHHDVIHNTLKDLSVKENDQDFTPLEVASAAIVAACEKIKNQLSPTNGHCCC